MDKLKNKKSFENLKNTVFGYSIEYGDTTYGNTLEERIQAAKAACSSAKLAQKQTSKGKCSMTSSRNAPSNNDINTTFKKTNNAQEFKKKNKPLWSSSFKPDSKPSYKGGLMQRRLEAIKSNKELSSIMSFESDNSLESTKYSNNLPKTLNYPSTVTNNYVSNQFNNNKPKEYITKSTIQNYPCNKTDYNSSTVYCNSTQDITKNSNNLVTSVQNRLTKAKEQIIAKSKLYSQNGAPKCTDSFVTSVQNRVTRKKEQITSKSKFPVQSGMSNMGEIVKKPSTATCSVNQEKNALVHNGKSKTKRLNQSSHSVKKMKPSIVSTSKQLFSNHSEIINKQLVTVQKKPITLTSTIQSSSNSAVSTKSGSVNILKKSDQKELDSFSFVTPQTFSVQQRLENIKKIHSNNDDIMEWEDIIIEPSNIVDKVNDLRRTTQDYEPMEWIPDSIMHSDQINHCLVVDTNILLSELYSITVIIDTYLPDYGYPTIVLPWQVLQELDYMKKGTNALGYRSRLATRWILEMLSKSHPRLKGQPMTTKKTENPDDAILKCAIIVKESVNFVNLVTDDKILSIKSEVNGIATKNSTWLKNVTSVPIQNESRVFQGSLLHT